MNAISLNEFATGGTIGLGDLVAAADLQMRWERKYLVPVTELASLRSIVPTEARLLEIGGETSFPYRSVYYDTPEGLSYHDARCSRRHRFKVRLRTYEASGLQRIDVKRSGANLSANAKVALEVVDQPSTSPQTALKSSAVSEFLDVALRGGPWSPTIVDTLTPTVSTVYQRSTLYDPLDNSRCTMDTELRLIGRAHMRSLNNVVIVETKSGVPRSRFDRLLVQAGYRPITLSKFALATIADRPQLPHNKWNRALRFLAEHGSSVVD